MSPVSLSLSLSLSLPSFHNSVTRGVAGATVRAIEQSERRNECEKISRRSVRFPPPLPPPPPPSPGLPLLIVNTVECGIPFSASILLRFNAPLNTARSSAFISVQFFLTLHQPPPYNDALLCRGNSSLAPLTRPRARSRVSAAVRASITPAKSNSKMKNRPSANADALFPRARAKCARVRDAAT